VQRPIREVENSGLRVAGLLPVRDVRQVRTFTEDYDAYI